MIDGEAQICLGIGLAYPHTESVDGRIVLLNDIALRKHACSNILKTSPLKNEVFRQKFNTFHISTQNIDCGYSLEPPCRGGSNEYTQSMFLSRSKKNNVYLC